MPLNPGDTLLNGQYQIRRELGRGGFGAVYQARDTLIQQHVAIKECIPALVGDEAVLRRFLAEARATMRLSHERIVRTHNIFAEGGNYYIVMELMPGGSLEDRLRARGVPPLDEALRIATEVGAGLSYAHRQGVVHCDLKPANILFAADGSARVADFGIAHVSDQSLTRSWYTSAGFAAGTLPYMSPEQTDGVRDDPRLDIYALGAVLYRLLSGRPYLDFDQRDTPRAQADNVYRIHNQPPVPPSVHNAQVPAWLDAVILKTLAKDPAGRYGSVWELLQALRGQVAPPPDGGDDEAAGAGFLAGWRWLGLGLVAVVVLALALGGWLLLGGGGEATATATPLPSATQLPTATLLPTVTPGLTASPLPTGTSLPAGTSIPTDTPLPTDTPAPTGTPVPAPTETPKAGPPYPELFQVGVQVSEQYRGSVGAGTQTRTIAAIGPDWIKTQRQRGSKVLTMFSQRGADHYEDQGESYGSSPWIPAAVYDALAAGGVAPFKNLPGDHGVTLGPARETTYQVQIDGRSVEVPALAAVSSNNDRYVILRDRDNPYVLYFGAGDYAYERWVEAIATP